MSYTEVIEALEEGGLLTYISSSLTSELTIPTENPLYFECLFVRIIFHENKRLIIGNIYRPPNSPTESTNHMLATINSLDHSSQSF